MKKNVFEMQMDLHRIHLKLLGFLLGWAKCQVLSALFYSTGTIPTAATCCASPSSISPQPAAPLPEPVRPCVRAKSPAADPAPPRPVRAPGGHVRSEPAAEVGWGRG